MSSFPEYNAQTLDQMGNKQLAELVKRELDKALKDPQGKLYNTLVKAAAYGTEQAVKEWGKGCDMCSVSQEEQVALRKLAGVVCDLGDGDVVKGAELLRDNAGFVRGFRRKTEKIGGTLITAVIISVVAFAAAVVGLGVRAWIGLGGGPGG